jgi:hypothetical protein
LANTSPVSIHALPSSSRSSAWRRRCARSTSSVPASRLTVRALVSVYVSPSTTSASTWTPRLTDRDRLPVEVDVAPRQPEGLGAAQPTKRDQVPQGVLLVVCSEVEEGAVCGSLRVFAQIERAAAVKGAS